MKTVVYQLGTENKYIYTLPPEIAVVNAYYQHEKLKNKIPVRGRKLLLPCRPCDNSQFTFR